MGKKREGPPVYSWDTQKNKKPYGTRKYDAYPNLRNARHVKVDKNAPRRNRVISKALLRAQRRWDLYGTVVRTNELDGRASAKTTEWRLIRQNLKLLQAIRKMGRIPERKERLDGRNEAKKRHDPYVPKVSVFQDDGFGE